MTKFKGPPAVRRLEGGEPVTGARPWGALGCKAQERLVVALEFTINAGDLQGVGANES